MTNVSHTGGDSKRKLLSASILQLPKMFLLGKTWMTWYINVNVIIKGTHYFLITGPIC